MTEARDLLVELGVEELPPKALQGLAQALAENMQRGLRDERLEHGECSWYATPRRLAVLVRQLAASQADNTVEKRGPALSAAYNEAGEPTKAALGFARSCGVEPEQLETLETDKGKWLCHRHVARGARTAARIPDIINQALTDLPIPRRMRWGAGDIEFARPVHWVVLLFGEELIHSRVLGMETGRETRGHRFHHPAPVQLDVAGEYAEKLAATAYVVADFKARRERVRQAVDQAAQDGGGKALVDAELLDETTALVEWPVAVAGTFADEFLTLPPEVLIATMQGHQKYFPVVNPNDGRLQARFVAVANIESADPEQVKRGNERVIHPRLSDAAFFWQRDRTRTLEQFGEGLDRVVFQQKLGSLADKTARIEALGLYMAEQLALDQDAYQRAARLAKCDLLTAMVAEFPELQGIMGRCYAVASGEPAAVAQALDEQYMPRHAGDRLPQGPTGRILALADKLDTLMGMFAVSGAPSGDKDPFGLRRAALGCLRIMVECALPLDLEDCIARAATTFPQGLATQDAQDALFDFMQERLRGYYLEQGVSATVFDAVQAGRPTRPHDFHLRALAVSDFLQRPEAASLVAANKRIRNLLKQTALDDKLEPDPALLREQTEIALYEQLCACPASEHLEQGDYRAALLALAGLRDAVDAFFDEVMVLCEDRALSNNRLALLSALRGLFLATADLSRLQ